MAAAAMLATTVATRRTCGEGPVGMLGRGGLSTPLGASLLTPSALPVGDATAASVRRRAGRDVRRGWLVHQVGSSELPAPSTLPVSDVFMGYS